MRVSVIVNNFNYARFLCAAVDSALAQTHADTEVIVVDDGSTDGSRDVISRYGNRVTPVFKANGGQASAFNAGFAASTGEVVLFLDADDVLLPDAVGEACAAFAREGLGRPLAKVQWPMWVVDEQCRRSGATRPPLPPPEGDFRDVVLTRGPTNCVSSPTSGNAWSRAFLEWALPAPEDVAYYRLCADEYLYTLAPIWGDVRTITQPQGLYRVHGSNVYSSRTPQQKLQLELEGHGQQCAALGRFLWERGIAVDLDAWCRHSWFHRMQQAIDELTTLSASDETLILIDDGTWGTREWLGTRRAVYLQEADGTDWGPPADDEAAIDHLERWRRQGAALLAIAWPSFWWMDHYRGFARYVESRFKEIIRNERLIVFAIGQRADEPSPPPAVQAGVAHE